MNKIKVMMLIGHIGDGGAQQIALNYLKDFKGDSDIELVLYVQDKEKINNKYNEMIKKENLNVKYIITKDIKCKIPIIKKIVNKKLEEKAWYDAIKEYNPDIIHIHIANLVYRVFPAIKKLNKKIVFTHIHSYPNRVKRRELKVIKKSFAMGFIPLCVTNEIGELSKKYFKIEKYECVYNGIDIKEIIDKKLTKKDAREKIEIDNDKFILLGVGRLNKIKRFDLLIKIFNEYLKHNSNAMLLILGDGPEFQSLNNMIRKMNLTEKIKMLGNQSIIPYYCASDILLITSENESASLVLLEAQICGLKCVISKGVPNESIITNKVIKVENDLNVQEWIKAIDMRSKYEKNTNTQEDYDMHKMSKKLKDIYLNYYKKINE